MGGINNPPTDSVSSAEGFGDVLVQFRMNTEFEVQQVHLNLAVLHIQTILHHCPVHQYTVECVYICVYVVMCNACVL